MGQDEDRLVERWIVPPPALPRIIAPWSARRRSELASSHDLGADVRVHLVDDTTADVLLATLHTGAFTPCLEPDQPVVQPFATYAEGLLLGLIRSRAVAIDRDRDMGPDLAHVPPSRR